MAFDGFAVHALKEELSRTLTGGLIVKITQPEKDEIHLTVKSGGTQYRLLLSANPALPLCYLTDKSKQSPMTAPAFCMLLRKHIGSGRITGILQPSFDRILVFVIEHRNELGDLCTKKLILELMGKYSNLIFTDDNDVILDAIRRVSFHMSSVREVLPGRTYFIPDTAQKKDPLQCGGDDFIEALSGKNLPLSKAVSASFTGFSSSMSEELLYRAGLDSRKSFGDLDVSERLLLADKFELLMREARTGQFRYNILYENGRPKEFFVLESRINAHSKMKEYPGVSEMISDYYLTKENDSRVRQRTADLRKTVSSAIEKNAKKLSLLEAQMADTQKMDQYRLYGELLMVAQYSVTAGTDTLETENYYTGETVRIPLDRTKSISDNAQRYFERYNKLKRTAVSAAEQIEETKQKLDHLSSIRISLDSAADEADLKDIRDELAAFGYMKKASDRKDNKGRKKSAPLKYLSSDGFTIYVGKNNYQNEELTFKLAASDDWWFHVKGAHGSHVIIQTKGREVPDRTFEEAGSLAAYYSDLRSSAKAEVDYTLKKNIKKPKGNIPGFVVYYSNYSLMADTDISGINLVK